MKANFIAYLCATILVLVSSLAKADSPDGMEKVNRLCNLDVSKIEVNDGRIENLEAVVADFKRHGAVEVIICAAGFDPGLNFDPVAAVAVDKSGRAISAMRYTSLTSGHAAE